MRISVNTKSIDRALKQIQRYQKNLDKTINRFMKRMTEEGLQILNVNIGHIHGNEVDPNVTGSAEVTALGNGNYQATIKMTGHDVAFIEFGSGIINNNVSLGGSLHPKGQELGMTIGSYPNQKHAGDPKGWWHDGHHYYGSETYMPLYSTEQELKQLISEIASEVFNEFK